MKTLKIVPFLAILLLFVQTGFSQTQTSEKISVSGECGMCKKKIEKAAKDAGASYAVWASDTKILEVKYDGKTTSSDKIQQQIADAGYDTQKFRAKDEVYEKLSPCCHYEREGISAKTDSKKCDMKDGKCADGSQCNGKDHAKKDGAMNCSEGSGKGKSCCQKKS